MCNVRSKECTETLSRWLKGLCCNSHSSRFLVRIFQTLFPQGRKHTHTLYWYRHFIYACPANHASNFPRSGSPSINIIVISIIPIHIENTRKQRFLSQKNALKIMHPPPRSRRINAPSIMHLQTFGGLISFVAWVLLHFSHEVCEKENQ